MQDSHQKVGLALSATAAPIKAPAWARRSHFYFQQWPDREWSVVLELTGDGSLRKAWRPEPEW